MAWIVGDEPGVVEPQHTASLHIHRLVPIVVALALDSDIALARREGELARCLVTEAGLVYRHLGTIGVSVKLHQAALHNLTARPIEPVPLYCISKNHDGEDNSQHHHAIDQCQMDALASLSLLRIHDNIIPWLARSGMCCVSHSGSQQVHAFRLSNFIQNSAHLLQNPLCLEYYTIKEGTRGIYYYASYDGHTWWARA